MSAMASSLPAAFIVFTVAGERATAEEAQAMVARAIEAHEAEGKTAFIKMTANKA